MDLPEGAFELHDSPSRERRPEDRHQMHAQGLPLEKVACHCWLSTKKENDFGMNSHIENCPFCGSSASMQNDFNIEFWVKCIDLKCGSVDGTIHEFPQSAIDRWNRRPVLVSANILSAKSYQNGSAGAYFNGSDRDRVAIDAAIRSADSLLATRMESRDRRKKEEPYNGITQFDRRQGDRRSILRSDNNQIRQDSDD